MQENTAIQQYAINDPSTHLKLAQELKKFVSDNRLITKLQGKDYANVEAWEYIGTSMGVFPILEDLQHIERPDEIVYRATVALHNIHTGVIVGRGVALCSSKEPGKKGFQEYAIASMAQTRAVGKAYRLPFGWLMKAAGYEPTPAEEMDAVEVPATKPFMSDLDVETEARRKDLVSLLNHELITKEEKDKVLASVVLLNLDKIIRGIAYYENLIMERGGVLETEKA
jgi:hypothetical protein